MGIFLSLLPIFIFGNLHCAGMCGPLVMLLAKNPYRWWYFLGRTAGFAFAGILSAELGLILFSFLSRYHISAVFSLLFGLWIVFIGSALLFRVTLPGTQWVAKRSAKLSAALARFLARQTYYTVFLFGLSTILLPCGQTLIVFSVIALKASPLWGLINGALFAICTSPSLIAMMHASHFLTKQKKDYPLWIGSTTVFIGIIALLRGCADLDLIKHCILNPNAAPHYHIVFF